jgi:hypothetical protein
MSKEAEFQPGLWAIGLTYGAAGRSGDARPQSITSLSRLPGGALDKGFFEASRRYPLLSTVAGSGNRGSPPAAS